MRSSRLRHPRSGGHRTPAPARNSRVHPPDDVRAASIAARTSLEDARTCSICPHEHKCSIGRREFSSITRGKLYINPLPYATTAIYDTPSGRAPREVCRPAFKLLRGRKMTTNPFR